MQAIQGLILTPLMFLGGVFNPASVFPGWAQKLALANPLLYMVNAVRYGLPGVSDVRVSTAFAVMCVAAVALFLGGVTLLARGKSFRD